MCVSVPAFEISTCSIVCDNQNICGTSRNNKAVVRLTTILKRVNLFHFFEVFHQVNIQSTKKQNKMKITDQSQKSSFLKDNTTGEICVIM